MTIERFKSMAPTIQTNIDRIALALVGTTDNGGLIGQISRDLSEIDDKYQIAFERFKSAIEEAQQISTFRSTLLSMVWDALPIPSLPQTMITAGRMEGAIADAAESAAGTALGETGYSSMIIDRLQPGQATGTGPMDGSSFSASLARQLLDLHRFATDLLRLKLRVEGLVRSISRSPTFGRENPFLLPNSRSLGAFVDGWPNLLNRLQQTLAEVRITQQKLSAAHRVWAGRNGAITLEGYLWILWTASLSDHSTLDEDPIEARLKRTRLIGNPSVLAVDFGRWTSTNDTFVAWQHARGLRPGIESAFQNYNVPAIRTYPSVQG